MPPKIRRPTHRPKIEQANLELANRIGQEIIDILSREMEDPAFNPLQAIAGQLMALKALIQSGPQVFKPPKIGAFLDTIDDLLAALRVAIPMADAVLKKSTDPSRPDVM